MSTDTGGLPGLIATWRETYDRAQGELEAASEPLLDWLIENEPVRPSWLDQAIAVLTVAWDTYPEIMSSLVKIERYLREDDPGKVIPLRLDDIPRGSIKIENPDKITGRTPPT